MPTAQEVEVSKGGSEFLNSKDAHPEPGTSPRRNQLSSESDVVLVAGGNPLAQQPIPVANYSRSRHFLFDCFHYLLFLRLIFDQRKTLLEMIENALHLWASKYQKDSSKSKGSAKYESIAALKGCVEEEKRKIMAALNQLPSNHVMEGIVKLQNRLSAANTLTNFIPTRLPPGEVGKGFPSMPLTQEQLQQRNADKQQRRSLLTAHIQARTAPAALQPTSS